MPFNLKHTKEIPKSQRVKACAARPSSVRRELNSLDEGLGAGSASDSSEGMLSLCESTSDDKECVCGELGKGWESDSTSGSSSDDFDGLGALVAAASERRSRPEGPTRGRERTARGSNQA